MEQLVLTQILIDGTTTGIIEISLDEWVEGGICYKIPKDKIKEASKIEHINQTGVYILLGKNEITGKNNVYIGKSTNVYKRLINHNYKKKFWSECLVFVSETNKLGETHISYIESVLCERAKKIKRYEIQNDQNPKRKSINKVNKIECDKFINKIEIVVSMLGY